MLAVAYLVLDNHTLLCSLLFAGVFDSFEPYMNTPILYYIQHDIPQQKPTATYHHTIKAQPSPQPPNHPTILIELSCSSTIAGVVRCTILAYGIGSSSSRTQRTTGCISSARSARTPARNHARFPRWSLPQATTHVCPRKRHTQCVGTG